MAFAHNALRAATRRCLGRSSVSDDEDKDKNNDNDNVYKYADDAALRVLLAERSSGHKVKNRRKRKRTATLRPTSECERGEKQLHVSVAVLQRVPASCDKAVETSWKLPQHRVQLSALERGERVLRVARHTLQRADAECDRWEKKIVGTRAVLQRPPAECDRCERTIVCRRAAFKLQPKTDLTTTMEDQCVNLNLNSDEDETGVTSDDSVVTMVSCDIHKLQTTEVCSSSGADSELSEMRNSPVEIQESNEEQFGNGSLLEQSQGKAEATQPERTQRNLLEELDHTDETDVNKVEEERSNDGDDEQQDETDSDDDDDEEEWYTEDDNSTWHMQSELEECSILSASLSTATLIETETESRCDDSDSDSNSDSDSDSNGASSSTSSDECVKDVFEMFEIKGAISRLLYRREAQRHVLRNVDRSRWLRNIQPFCARRARVRTVESVASLVTHSLVQPLTASSKR